MNPAALGIAGRNILPYRSGYGAEVMADVCKFLTIGATIDWSLFPPAPAQVVLPDTEVIQAGWVYARYGQVFCRITGAGQNTLTVTGPTFTISVTNAANGATTTQTTAAIPAGAGAAVVAQALYGLINVGPQNATVTGGNGGPYAISFPAILGTTTVAATGGTFAAGPGGNQRFFGPYDPNATDGRQVLTRGDCFVANRTKVAGGSFQIPLRDDYHTGECITGGKVWGLKVLATNGTPSLASGPAWPALLAATTLEPFYV